MTPQPDHSASDPTTPGRPTPEPETAPRPRVAVVADDLIWASRLAAAVERSGAEPVRLAAARPSLDGARLAGAIVDLGGRRYDGIAAIELFASADTPVIAVAQHDDVALRKRGLAAGAARVYSYNKLFRDGPALIAAWLRSLA